MFLFVFVSVRTQQRLGAGGQHHFEQSENIVFNKRTQNEVAFGKQCCASHKRCGFANDVALRANLMLRIVLPGAPSRRTLQNRHRYDVIYRAGT